MMTVRPARCARSQRWASLGAAFRSATEATPAARAVMHASDVTPSIRAPRCAGTVGPCARGRRVCGSTSVGEGFGAGRTTRPATTSAPAARPPANGSAPVLPIVALEARRAASNTASVHAFLVIRRPVPRETYARRSSAAIGPKRSLIAVETVRSSARSVLSAWAAIQFFAFLRAEADNFSARWRFYDWQTA